VAFGILSQCFTQWPSFLLHYFPPSKIWNQLAIFGSTRMGVFKRLLGLNSLECPEAPIVRRQVALSISNGGIGLISLEVITPSTYIKS